MNEWMNEQEEKKLIFFLISFHIINKWGGGKKFFFPNKSELKKKGKQRARLTAQLKTNPAHTHTHTVIEKKSLITHTHTLERIFFPFHSLLFVFQGENFFWEFKFFFFFWLGLHKFQKYFNRTHTHTHYYKRSNEVIENNKCHY